LILSGLELDQLLPGRSETNHLEIREPPPRRIITFDALDFMAWETSLKWSPVMDPFGSVPKGFEAPVHGCRLLPFLVTKELDVSLGDRGRPVIDPIRVSGCGKVGKETLEILEFGIGRVIRFICLRIKHSEEPNVGIAPMKDCFLLIRSHHSPICVLKNDYISGHIYNGKFLCTKKNSIFTLASPDFIHTPEVCFGA